MYDKGGTRKPQVSKCYPSSYLGWGAHWNVDEDGRGSDDEEEQCEPQERASWQCLLGEDLSEEEDSSPSEDQEQDEGRLQDD